MKRTVSEVHLPDLTDAGPGQGISRRLYPLDMEPEKESVLCPPTSYHQDE